MDTNQKFDLILNALEQHDREIQAVNRRLDLTLIELKKICKTIEDSFEKINNKIDNLSLEIKSLDSRITILEKAI